MFLMLSGLHVKAFEPIVSSDSLRCAGDGSGKIRILIHGSNPGFQCVLSTDSLFKRQISKTGIIKDSSFVFNQLPAGNYFLLFRIAGGNVYRSFIRVGEPPQLIPGKVEIVKGLSSSYARDAILKANPSGGNPPYTYLWGPESGSQTTAEAKNVIQGTHHCVIQDSRKCGPVALTVFFNQEEYPDFVPLPEETHDKNKKLNRK
jgi:hypothetical protein